MEVDGTRYGGEPRDGGWDLRLLIRVALIFGALVLLVLCLVAVVAAPVPLFLSGHTVLAAFWGALVAAAAWAVAVAVRAIERRQREDRDEYG